MNSAYWNSPFRLTDLQKKQTVAVDVAGKPVFSRILDKLDFLSESLGVDVSLSVTLSEETIKNTKDILNLVDTYGVKAFGFNIMMSSDTFVLPQSYNEASAQLIIDEFIEIERAWNIRRSHDA